MKKRVISMLLITSLVLMSMTSLVGCQTTKSEETTGTSTTTEATDTTDSQTTEEAASTDAQTTEAAEYDNELHIAYKIEPASLDTMKIADAPARIVSYGSIYESLVTLDAEFKVKEELAESYEVNDDNTEYSWKLREGIKFHNGEVMTADDAVASMNRWVENYANAQTMVGDSRFEKVDDYTIKIVLSEPAIFLNELIATQTQGSVIIPKSVIDDLDPDTGMVKEYIGTGPYKFSEWKEGVYIKLDKYEDYQPYGIQGETSGWWGYKSAYTEIVYYEFVTDTSTRTTGIQTGEFDMATEMSADDFAMFEAADGLNTFKELNGNWMIVYNKESGLTQDVNMRQAVNAIANPLEIMTSAHGLSDFFRIETSYMPEETANWYTTAGSDNAHLQNAELAKEYLEKANYNGETFRILAPSDDINFTNAAVALKSELEAIGMTVEIVAPDWTSYSSYRSDPSKYEVFFASLIPVSVPTLQVFLSSTWAGFTNDQNLFDAVKEINKSSSLEEAQVKWEDLQKYIWEDSLPATKLAAAFIYSVYSDNVENYDSFCSGPIIGNIRVKK